MKALVSLMVVFAAASAQAQDALTAKYSNAEGCKVEIEQARNGARIYIQDSKGQSAFLGILNDYSSGDIAAFCKDAKVALDKEKLTITLSCGEQEESGSLSTRGTAILDATNGLSSVKVKGQVKRLFGWKTDTDISCENLKAE